MKDLRNIIVLGRQVQTNGDDTETACYPLGTCTNTTLFDKYALYDKFYSLEEAALLRSLGVFGSQMLQGYASAGRRYMTVIPNVKDKTVMFGEDMFKFTFDSEVTGGRGKTDCGPFMCQGDVDFREKCLHTYYLHIDACFCYKKLIGTFKQRILRPGTARAEENDALNDMIIDGVIKSANEQIDHLIWMGDYGSSEKKYAHFDGIIKRTVSHIDTETAQTFCIEMVKDIEAGDCIQGLVGGEMFTVDFDTDAATTLAALQMYFMDLTHSTTGEPAFTVVFDGVSKITITANYHDCDYNGSIHLAVTDCSGYDAQRKCANNTGVGSLLFTEVIDFQDNDCPIVCPYTPVNPGNVIEIFCGLYLKASMENSDLMFESDFVFHVDPAIYNMMIKAQTSLSAAFNGIGTAVTPQYLSLDIVPQRALMGTGIIYGTTADNLFFGTDLLADWSDVSQKVDWDCQTTKMRYEVTAGVQVNRYDMTVSNLDCYTREWKPVHEEYCSVLNPCKEKIQEALMEAGIEP